MLEQKYDHMTILMVYQSQTLEINVFDKKQDQEQTFDLKTQIRKLK